jgi:acylphosphatase
VYMFNKGDGDVVVQYAGKPLSVDKFTDWLNSTQLSYNKFTHCPSPSLLNSKVLINSIRTNSRFII